VARSDGFSRRRLGGDDVLAAGPGADHLMGDRGADHLEGQQDTNTCVSDKADDPAADC
jgi:hypothetical protein